MPRGTRHTVTGILHLARRGFELHVDGGGVWALDVPSRRRTRKLVDQRVTVVGTRSGFDLLDVHDMWTASGHFMKIRFSQSNKQRRCWRSNHSSTSASYLANDRVLRVQGQGLDTL